MTQKLLQPKALALGWFCRSDDYSCVLGERFGLETGQSIQNYCKLKIPQREMIKTIIIDDEVFAGKHCQEYLSEFPQFEMSKFVRWFWGVKGRAQLFQQDLIFLECSKMQRSHGFEMALNFAKRSSCSDSSPQLSMSFSWLKAFDAMASDTCSSHFRWSRFSQALINFCRIFGWKITTKSES